jgi:hypothetical protein
MTNQELYDKAKEAIDELFGDTTVSISKCRSNLNGLIGKINLMLDTLEENDDDNDDAADEDEDD